MPECGLKWLGIKGNCCQLLADNSPAGWFIGKNSRFCFVSTNTIIIISCFGFCPLIYVWSCISSQGSTVRRKNGVNYNWSYWNLQYYNYIYIWFSLFCFVSMILLLIVFSFFLLFYSNKGGKLHAWSVWIILQCLDLSGRESNYSTLPKYHVAFPKWYSWPFTLRQILL